MGRRGLCFPTGRLGRGRRSRLGLCRFLIIRVIQLYLFGAVAGIVHRINRHFLAVPGVILQGHGPLAVDKAVDTGIIHIHRLHAGHIIAGLYRQFVVI